jgi:hypothetical protein
MSHESEDKVAVTLREVSFGNYFFIDRHLLRAANTTDEATPSAIPHGFSRKTLDPVQRSASESVTV